MPFFIFFILPIDYILDASSAPATLQIEHRVGAKVARFYFCLVGSSANNPSTNQKFDSQHLKLASQKIMLKSSRPLTKQKRKNKPTQDEQNGVQQTENSGGL